MAKGKNKKKPSYNLFNGMGKILLKNLTKEYGTGPFKKNTLVNIAHHMSEITNRQFVLSEDIETYSREYALEKDNHPAIFPDSGLLLAKLFESEYILKDDLVLDFPFENFSVAMPKNLLIDDCPMPGFMVNIGEFNTIRENSLGALSKAMGNNELYKASEDSTKVVYVTFTHPASKQLMSSTMDETHLSQVLKSKNLDEYKSA
jgi:hypothetical protein